MENFLSKLTKILDVDGVKASDMLTDFPQWNPSPCFRRFR